MSNNNNISSEIRSEKAKLVVDSLPPTVIRIGIASLIILFGGLLSLLSIINIQPYINVNVIIIGEDCEITSGYALLPYCDISSEQNTIPISVVTNNGRIMLKCGMTLNDKQIYIDSNNVQWMIPLVFDNINNKYCFEGKISATTRIQTEKIALLTWIIQKVKGQTIMNIVMPQTH